MGKMSRKSQLSYYHRLLWSFLPLIPRSKH